MRDCSVTGWGRTIMSPDLVLVTVCGESMAPGLAAAAAALPAKGESLIAPDSLPSHRPLEILVH